MRVDESGQGVCIQRIDNAYVTVSLPAHSVLHYPHLYFISVEEYFRGMAPHSEPTQEAYHDMPLLAIRPGLVVGTKHVTTLG